MSYYDALIAAWNSTTQPPVGVLGSALVSTMTTVQKITVVNAWTVSGSVPTTIYVTGTQIANCINFTEFNALSTTKQASILTLCTIPGALLGGSGNTTHIAPGLIIANFTTGSQTIAALTALASATTWWSAPVASGGGGLSSPVTLTDTGIAGLS